MKNSELKKNVYCIMGPTACGKTDVAIHLSEKFPVEIISVDSAMVYRGMDIGTAKPSQIILDKTPHHLINILNPNQTYSAADFCADAERIMNDIVERGKTPLLVGGTMLYFKALQEGLSELPSADPATRERIIEEAASIGWEALHKKLKQVDPKAAGRIHANDQQRIERALEVFYLTGKSLSDHFDHSQALLNKKFNYYSIGLFPENREILHRRIEQRFHQMLVEGFIDEVKNLMEKQHLDLSSPAMRMVGYRQVGLHLTGQIDEKSMIDQSIAATRQLAKRQMTWLRSWKDIVLIDPFKENL